MPSKNPFEFKSSHPLPGLEARIETYRHGPTGAWHYHIANEQEENTFMVVFRTIPEDSSGVAHVLEHLVLCGSEKFPVRDPFFHMTRRSLNTFMNAFTSADWTGYPFATRNQKDYDNLLSVYLDAVFFPRLDPLDFEQEAHHLTLERVLTDAEGNLLDLDKVDQTSTTRLVRGGVVYNEMKGGMAQPDRQIQQALVSALCPTTPYRFNSGGDPEEILGLTLEKVEGFHRQYYQPSNATFITSGNRSPEEIQVQIHERALYRFRKERIAIDLKDEKPFAQPQVAHFSYQAIAPEDTPVLQMGWLSGHAFSASESLELMLVDQLLLGHDGAPLARFLGKSPLSAGMGSLTGADTSDRQGLFMVGMHLMPDVDPAEAETALLDVISATVEKGFSQEQVATALHRLELASRSISDGGMPEGLALSLRALPAIVHGGSVLELIDLESALTTLRKKTKDLQWVCDLVARVLLDNEHRVTLITYPDTEAAPRKARTEINQMTAMLKAMGHDELQAIMARDALRREHQNRMQDPGVLPGLDLGDVPVNRTFPEAKTSRLDCGSVATYPVNSHGLVYQGVTFTLEPLDEKGLRQLALFAAILPEMGFGGLGYAEAQSLIAEKTGGITAEAEFSPLFDDRKTGFLRFTVKGRALRRNAENLNDILYRMATKPEFNDRKRLRYVLNQALVMSRQSLATRGHVAASLLSESSLSPSAALAHYWDGVGFIDALTEAKTQCETKNGFKSLLENFQGLVNQLKRASRRDFVVVGEADGLARQVRAIETCWPKTPNSKRAQAFTPREKGDKQTAILLPIPVNYVASSHPVSKMSDPDSPVLHVLASYLSNQYLHTSIREKGGAYGVFCAYNPDSATFSFASYRDPRFSMTLLDFHLAVMSLAKDKEARDPRNLVDAILSTLAMIDNQGSEVSSALSHYYRNLNGRSDDWYRQARQRILDATFEDLVMLAERYLLQEDRPATGALIGEGFLSEAHQLKMQTRNLGTAVNLAA